MSCDSWSDLISDIKQSNATEIKFADGLNDHEIEATEARFGFHFPPDLREFLQSALPQGDRFPDWRSGAEPKLHEWLALPRRGILFDIEHNGFWLDEWGSKPESLEEATALATGLIRAAPKLIPIYAHRMIPDEPRLAGNPVISVHQTDIIYYGFDLTDYLQHEFKLPGRGSWPQEQRAIRFWDKMVSEHPAKGTSSKHRGFWEESPRSIANSGAHPIPVESFHR